MLNKNLEMHCELVMCADKLLLSANEEFYGSFKFSSCDYGDPSSRRQATAAMIYMPLTHLEAVADVKVSTFRPMHRCYSNKFQRMNFVKSRLDSS